MPVAATLLAFITIFLWSFLAYLGSRLTHVPPFLLVGIALCTSGVLGLIKIREWRVPLKTYLVGIGGIFGYHFLYFTAFQYAPPIETSLINYLWPLLIVVLSPLYLRGYSLRSYHLFGALLGSSGAGLIATGGHFTLDLANVVPNALTGYLFAAAAAFTWASYSLLTKRLPPFPSGAVGGFCLGSGFLSLGIYFQSSTLLGAALTLQDWILLILLGAGPMGLAFFTWDATLKRGDPRIIGSLAYLTPLLSTFFLIVLGGQKLSWVSGVAMVLIVSGAVTGSLDLLRSTNRITEEPSSLSHTQPHN